ncbi:MAG: leucyl aminopeptidase [Burkholderiales bacterium]|nr:leucyl aminopeptidase [Burkholderiales bacterium]
MDFSTKVSAPEKAKTGAVVVGVFEARRLSHAAEAIDRASRGALRALARRGDFEGKTGTTRVLFGVQGVAAERVILVGLGKESEVSAKSYRDAVRAATLAVADTGAADALLCVAELHVQDRDIAWKARHAVMAAADALYRFDEMKSKKPEARSLKRIALGLTAAGHAAEASRGVAEGRAITSGAALARDLGNLPGNVCTPAYLADRARTLAKEWKLGIEVLEQKDMEKLGMGSLLSVARGSRQPPKLIVLRHEGGAKREQPIVLVGKGITFDTGGISLKPAPEMDEMKFDMSGAGSVLGTLRAVAEMKLKANVIGIVPAAENMPGGAASKPGDIVTSLSGQTIEILNTDAEGRLILCDALTYAERFRPQAVVDIATLTGACVIALGHVATGLFTAKDELAQELLDAGEEAWDRAWRMPLWDDYQEQLKSPFADMANVGGRPAGSVTAACFLARFTKAYDWAHLDIAGTAWRSGKDKGSTGRPVPLLTQFLMNRAGKG